MANTFVQYQMTLGFPSLVLSKQYFLEHYIHIFKMADLFLSCHLYIGKLISALTDVSFRIHDIFLQMFVRVTFIHQQDISVSQISIYLCTFSCDFTHSLWVAFCRLDMSSSTILFSDDFLQFSQNGVHILCTTFLPHKYKYIYHLSWLLVHIIFLLTLHKLCPFLKITSLTD